MKWFRVATEGATTDGRKIQREWIQQMAANYDPKVYGARINLEHIKGVLPDSPFKAYGDVVALKAEEVDGGKLALFAQLSPTDELKALTKARQKVYTSIEVHPEFADTGEAYLLGLAVTDSPASLGTEMLQFSAQQNSQSPLAGRKSQDGALFSAAEETALDFAENPPKGPSVLDRVKAMFAKRDAKATELSEDLAQALELFGAELEKLASAEQFNTLRREHDALKAKFEQLYARVDKQPTTQPRKHATGGEAIEVDY